MHFHWQITNTLEEKDTQHLHSTLSFLCTCYITPTAIVKSSIMLSQPPAVELFVAIILKVFLSHHQRCETGVSVILRSRALPLWSDGTCPWCPHTQSKSGLLRHMIGTQISIVRTEKKEVWATTRHHILFYAVQRISLPDSFFHLHWELAGGGLKQI